MSAKKPGRLILLCGPSGVGKTPLARAIKKLDPELSNQLQPLVVYNNRLPRPGETEGVDYHFRTDESLETMRKDAGFIVVKVRGNFQAVDLERLQKNLNNGDVLLEGNTLMARALQLHEHLENVERISVFLSPLSMEEITFFKNPDRHVDLKQLVTEMMRRKLLRRAKKQKTILSLDELNDIEFRAHEANDDLGLAHHFDWVIPNHDGEDSEHWDGFYYPVGEAKQVTEDVINLIKNKGTKHAERWPADLVP